VSLKRNLSLAAACAAVVTLLTAPAAFAAEPKCGLSNGKAATGKPIALGGIVGRTGPADFSSSGDAAVAYFKCVNANGGINGRPIDTPWKTTPGSRSRRPKLQQNW
jgi:branched-chain amino acid transport system substrate-binding protein